MRKATRVAWSGLGRSLAGDPGQLAGASAIVAPFALLAVERERLAQGGRAGDGHSPPTTPNDAFPRSG